MDTVVIGIDGGEWDVLTPLIESGELPNLAELKREGVTGELESITPPVSPPAWTSIQTGMNPGKHGIFDFSSFDERYRRRSVNATQRRAIPFWYILNDNDVSTGLFKVPFTYPPGEVDGFIVTGFPTPNTVKDFATPASITDRIESPKPLFEDWSLQHDGKYEAFRDDLIRVVETQTDFLLELLTDYDVDFLMTVYDGADRIQHFFWKYFDETHPRHVSDSELSDAIPAYFRALDAAIGELLAEIGSSTNVIVLSDHGFGPLEKDIYIEEWLEDNGYLSRLDQSTPDRMLSQTAKKTVQYSWSAVKRAGLGHAIKEMLSEDAVLTGRAIKEGRRGTIDWDETTAFFTTLSGQAIMINFEERFSKGTVSPSEYDNVVEDLRTALLELQDPQTDEQVIEAVHHRDELFDGWVVNEAPDLVVECKPEYTLKGGRSEHLVTDAKQHAHERSGDHRSTGIIMAHGSAFGEGTVKGMNILDVAPSLLYLQGCPIPESMDGQVCQSLFTDEFRNSREIELTSQYGQVTRDTRQWTDSEEQELQDRLENMGYLQ